MSLTVWSLGRAADVQVQIRDFMFAPLQLQIPAGATVTWVNRDDEPHTVVSEEGLFRSGALDTDMTFAFRFERPGTYHVLCSLHPQMAAVIVVVQAPGGGPRNERGASAAGAPGGADRGP